MRDPRDLVVSLYFSVKVSHPTIGTISEQRENLIRLGKEEGLCNVIDRMAARGEFRALRSWAKIAPDDKNLAAFRYEDLTDSNQFATWRRLFAHCDIQMPDAQLRQLLERNSFAELTHGRERGSEDVSAHLRRGVAGDWKNHFTPVVEKKFQAVTGRLVDELGYEW